MPERVTGPGELPEHSAVWSAQGAAAGAGEAAPLPTPARCFELHGAEVFRLLRRLGVSDADADDVCQEVFVAVHRQLHNFEGRSKLRTWIYSIARKRASSYRARAHRRYEDLTDSPPEPQQQGQSVGASDPQQALERVRMRALLDRMLDALDEDKRAVFVLYEIEELAMREVVQVVGCPLQTGYSRLHAARRELRQAAARHGVTP